MNQRFWSKSISGRLPVYLQYLRELIQNGIDQTSATSIAKALHYGEVQVRKDLNLIAGTGKPGIGYNAAELLASLEAALGCGVPKEVILVGDSSLCRAILVHPGMHVFNFAVTAVFDHLTGEQPDEMQQPLSLVPVLDLSQLSAYCSSHSITAAFITSPQENAQEICDLLIASGISVIWNLTGKIIHVPDHVMLMHDSILSSLAYLSGNIRTNNG